ncbi:uncharacterized protein PHALS_02442 [Plasmopara halstedii]|uniref:Uncharacterized protein n=1 Tax=Plasmopara halstedii TaxID=4781 RepID=A0A0P1A6V0_PLAHL|nr:uncharacterized protein PHALS_02442 [Plasmopara halstedii]CEG36352.1 hypothetical protein PHALS_02442 [Plasmopara halstedii]|eukprot:XP_024572721.1 hypothetical protein PHALS_02442 [Plasmopara halstedii]
MAQSSGSYYNDYMRSNAMLKHCGEQNAKKLLTDRNAYISFLEVQLERVSAACLTSQTFEKRLAEIESAHSATDQKVGLLSKVFEHNQNYVGQISQQTRSEIAGYTAKFDCSINKLSAELERQFPRVDTLDEQFRQCQKYLLRLVETNDLSLNDVKEQTQQEVEKLKAQVVAFGARIEEIHSSCITRQRKVEEVTDAAFHKLDKELETIHSYVSENSFELERKVIQLANAFLRVEASETADFYKTQTVEFQRQLDQLQNKLEHGHIKMKNVLNKCLDSQHLLSDTMVALRSEVDDIKNGDAAAFPVGTTTMPISVEDLLNRQSKLKCALKVLQVCALEAQQTCEDRSKKLSDRMAAAEDLFDIRADDLRNNMLAALNTIGDRLNQDACKTARTTETQKEVGFEIGTKSLDTIGRRLGALEKSVSTLKQCPAFLDALGQARVIQDQLSHEYVDSVGESQTDNCPRGQEELQQRLIGCSGEKQYQSKRLHQQDQPSKEQRPMIAEGTSSHLSIASPNFPSGIAIEEASRRGHSLKQKRIGKRSLKMAQAASASNLIQQARHQRDHR